MICPRCSGQGGTEDVYCPKCQGSGEVETDRTLPACMVKPYSENEIAKLILWQAEQTITDRVSYNRFYDSLKRQGIIK